MALIFRLFIVVLACSVDHSFAEDKRLLLNDPETLLSQIHALQQELQELKSSTTEKFRLLESRNQIQGSVYIRWGKHSCPSLNNTVLLYTGTAGGSFYTDTGGGVNTLCLPHNPDFLPDQFSSLHQYGVGYLYGGEYQFSLKNVVIQDDVPCSVCRANIASSIMMIPGKLTCPSGWTKQYSGFLTSEEHGTVRSEYLCLDEDPDFIERSRGNENGRLFYPTVTVCGTLPCPPYKNTALVACVVCAL